MPQISSELSFADPELVANRLMIEDGDEYSAAGCYVGATFDVVPALMKSRGWDEAKANRAYFRLIGAGLVSGEVAFYGTSPLATPPGWRYLGEGCDQGRDIAAIRASQAFLAENFSEIIRTTGQYVACKEGETIFSGLIGPQMQAWTDRGATNVWFGLEVLVIAMAADWHQDWDHRQKGAPRPPLCRETPIPVVDALPE
ncbi:hypothetical protein HOY34_00040 [Xinfangfangia sp. D13-10-4-6]|uniref:hypothetical protein n=1 Tax=Pseudogemmobacter hezensis TaxID=2737662 RepID=UPI001557D59C|nr:hypothetical protein [Pseudogemmobacter hezensis]NPD13588.1 hypothetical protein [Pseudogemmobacter hezensis]